MLNEKKVRLMTSLAVYEEGRGIGDAKEAKYFGNDYIFAGMLRSIVTGTLAWGICAALYCGYFFEQIFFSVYEDTLGPLLRLAAMSYAAFMALYLIATFLIYYRRRAAYDMRRTMYADDMDALMEICEQEDWEQSEL